jgi:predicted  nucleic acid-binding Zn-ribbon protein
LRWADTTKGVDQNVHAVSCLTRPFSHSQVRIRTPDIERLEQALEAAQVRANELQQQLDTARDEAATAEKARAANAAQVEALNTVLAVERERLADERARVDEWKAVADRFALQAEALAARPSRFFGWFRRWASG